MILFHGPTHARDSPRFPNIKPTNSIYALLSMEQPKYATILSNKQDLEKHFDLIATYSLEPYYPGTKIPNLPLTYYPLNILSMEAVLQDPRPFSKKSCYKTGITQVNSKLN